MILAAGAGVITAVLMRQHPEQAASAASSQSQAPVSGFAGYRGQHGTVTVASMAPANGTVLAAGTADGHPAIWRRDDNGTWTLVTGASPSVSALEGTLAGIAQGPQGWIAVGNSASAGAPIAVTSADGVNWRVSTATFPGPDAFVTAVAAGPRGYAVVGRLSGVNHVRAAMWWSTDLRHWSEGNNDKGGKLDGRLAASAVDAVAATPDGDFVASGWHVTSSTMPAVWTSADGGQTWIFDASIPLPPGASSATLSLVTANGNGVAVTAGHAVINAADVPIAAVSTDSGGQWNLIRLKAPGGQGAVTALTPAGSGFILTGVAGPAGTHGAVTWNLPGSPSRWPDIAPTRTGTPEITALSAAGGTLTAAAQQGRSVTLPGPSRVP